MKMRSSSTQSLLQCLPNTKQNTKQNTMPNTKQNIMPNTFFSLSPNIYRIKQSELQFQQMGRKINEKNDHHLSHDEKSFLSNDSKVILLI
jgi:hypothetical protein